MKRTLSWFLPICLIAVLSIFGCGPDPDPDPDPDTNVVHITADITQPTVWSGDSIYLIRQWDFYVLNTLTIEPGCIIKFHPTEGPVMNLGGAGTVIANGTAAAPIIFTSYKDDAHGGDTNLDGGATTPARKDWYNVNTNGQNGSSFRYCEFYYGGGSTYSSTLSIETGSIATVVNCTFAHNAGDDPSGWYGALDASSADAGTVITGNLFYDNIRPLSINTKYSLDNSNQFSVTGETPNSYNGIFVETIDHLATPILWSETEVAYVIDDNDWWIQSGGNLTLADNVVLKFRPGSVFLLENGLSNLNNYDGAGVFFTSYKDDAHKGDTNGDGNATAPANGDWVGIYDDSGVIPSPYYYSWGNILYDSY